jgi:hypothetical protein
VVRSCDLLRTDSASAGLKERLSRRTRAWFAPFQGSPGPPCQELGAKPAILSCASGADDWKKTGGKVKSSRTRTGKNRAATALRLAAWSLVRSHSYLGAYLRRQRARLGAPKAITATAHKLARILYNLLRYGAAYMKQEEAAYAEQVRQRQEKQLQRRAKELGYVLTKLAPAAAGPADAPPP